MNRYIKGGIWRDACLGKRVIVVCHYRHWEEFVAEALDYGPYRSAINAVNRSYGEASLVMHSGGTIWHLPVNQGAAGLRGRTADVVVLANGSSLSDSWRASASAAVLPVDGEYIRA